MMTLAKSKQEGAEKLFDKRGDKNYIDCLIEFVDNAKAGSVNVDDIKDLEDRLKKLKEDIKRVQEETVLAENMWADLMKKLSDKTIKHFADGVQRYFKQSGYLDNIQTEVSDLYMTRWTKFIVDYMQRNHIPLVKLDIEKLAKEVGEYLIKHCRKMKYCQDYCDTCSYIPDSDYELCRRCH